MTAAAVDRAGPARPRPVRLRPLRRPGRGAGDAATAPLRRTVAVGVALGTVLTLLAVAAGAVAIVRLGDARRTLLDAAGPALDRGRDLEIALLDQETGVRGFALAGRPELLEPYRAGLAAEADARRALAELDGPAGFTDLGDDLAVLDRAARAWRTAYAEPVVAGAAVTDAQQGRILFDRVRAALTVLQDDLRAEQAAARARVNAAASALTVVGLLVAALLAAFLVVATVGLRRHVLGPVSRLAAQVREVVSGDVHRAVRAGGPRELAELGADVEAMRAYIVHELGTVQDANRRLDEQARELERSNRDLEQFAYVASHDLQEPLRKVSSFCSLLQRRYGGRLDERADQYIGFAVDGAQRMQQLINDLLAFSRVGRTTEGFERVELADVASAVTAQLAAACEESGGTLTVGELPAVTGDPVLLRQLLVNLVGNGLKFRRDEVPPVVEVRAARAAGGMVELTVADNGIGIEPEYADKVFVIFQRLHGRERYPGTGIGLALAKKIVEFHGGRIGLDAGRPGPGTTVRLTLPAAPAGPGPAPEPEE